MALQSEDEVMRDAEAGHSKEEAVKKKSKKVLLVNPNGASQEIVDSKVPKINLDNDLKEFLPTISFIFNASRWFGIPLRGEPILMCISLILLFLLIGLETAAIWKLIRAFGGWAVVKGSVTARLSGALFYGNALCSQILSWKFISSWKDLSFYWAKIEIAAIVIRLPQDDKIKTRMLIVTSSVAALATLEHALSMMAATGMECPPSQYFRNYILSSHGFLIHSYEYNLWIAIPIFILSKIATILWNFQDLIIILVSMGLTSRYHRLNSCVNCLLRSEKRYKHIWRFGTDKYMQEQKWRRLREAYVRQAELVRRIDGKLGALILLSNFNNLYFICLQLFLGINNDQGPLINKMYYYLSLSWLILRACSVVIAAADIHVQSKSALPLLYSCPHGSYNVEISRLRTQLTYDSVALKGMGLFALDRKLLLVVAAAVLKYELGYPRIFQEVVSNGNTTYRLPLGAPICYRRNYAKYSYGIKTIQNELILKKNIHPN